MAKVTALEIGQGTFSLPATIARAGNRAERRFIEFFTANIRNPNTRRAYLRAVLHFFDWCERYDWHLAEIKPVGVAAYTEKLMQERAAPTVKQHLAAIRMLFDYLVVGQIVPFNPAAAVRGPKHVVKKGKNPVLFEEDARLLIESINTDILIGFRDRAILGVMTYSFARVGAASFTGCPRTIKLRIIWKLTSALRRSRRTGAHRSFEVGEGGADRCQNVD